MIDLSHSIHLTVVNLLVTVNKEHTILKCLQMTEPYISILLHKIK